MCWKTILQGILAHFWDKMKPKVKYFSFGYIKKRENWHIFGKEYNIASMFINKSIKCYILKCSSGIEDSFYLET